MKDIDNETLRRQLVERYMSGDTTPEEERQLLMFYRDGSARWQPEEEGVRRLVLAVGTSDAGAMSSGDGMPDDDAAAEFDRILEAASAKSKRHASSKRKLIRIAIASVASVAAVLALLFLPPRLTTDDTPSAMPSSTGVAVMSIADACELVETAFSNSENITVENTDGQTIVTVTTPDGGKASYELTSCRDDSYTLVAIH